MNRLQQCLILSNFIVHFLFSMLISFDLQNNGSSYADTFYIKS